VAGDGTVQLPPDVLGSYPPGTLFTVPPFRRVGDPGPRQQPRRHSPCAIAHGRSSPRRRPAAPRSAAAPPPSPSALVLCQPQSITERHEFSGPPEGLRVPLLCTPIRNTATSCTNARDSRRIRKPPITQCDRCPCVHGKRKPGVAYWCAEQSVPDVACRARRKPGPPPGCCAGSPGPAGPGGKTVAEVHLAVAHRQAELLGGVPAERGVTGRGRAGAVQPPGRRDHEDDIPVTTSSGASDTSTGRPPRRRSCRC
jgi:hypothetical protein